MIKSKEISVKVEGKEAKWKWDGGARGKIYVYDCWWNSKEGMLYIDIEVIPGTTSDALKSAGIVLVQCVENGNRMGTLCRSGVVGHVIVKCSAEHEWQFGYGIDIIAEFGEGWRARVITIPFGEIRRI